jgi:hypothetical protein
MRRRDGLSARVSGGLAGEVTASAMAMTRPVGPACCDPGDSRIGSRARNRSCRRGRSRFGSFGRGRAAGACSCTCSRPSSADRGGRRYGGREHPACRRRAPSSATWRRQSRSDAGRRVVRMNARTMHCARLLIRPLLAVTRQIRAVSRLATASKGLISSWASCSAYFRVCDQLLGRALLAVDRMGSPRRVFRLASPCGAAHSR